MTTIEEEVILLKAVKELIDTMVSRELLDMFESDLGWEVKFRTHIRMKFFVAVLVDFLSCTDKKASIKKTSYVGGLRAICAKPSFASDNSVTLLDDATKSLAHWLETGIEHEAWFPSLNKKPQLSLRRIDFLKMCGNISKHNFLRLVTVAEELRDHLDAAGVTVTTNEALVALADFYDQFESILRYHVSTIAELLNNLRWGIFHYLRPEFERSIVWKNGDPPIYGFTYPSGVNARLAKECYWELMNEVREEPTMPRFLQAVGPSCGIEWSWLGHRRRRAADPGIHWAWRLLRIRVA